MGIRKINKARPESTKAFPLRRNEALITVAGRLIAEYEKSPNQSLLLEAQKLIEFVAEDMHLRDIKLK